MLPLEIIGVKRIFPVYLSPKLKVSSNVKKHCQEGKLFEREPKGIRIEALDKWSARRGGRHSGYSWRCGAGRFQFDARHR